MWEVIFKKSGNDGVPPPWDGRGVSDPYKHAILQHFCYYTKFCSYVKPLNHLSVGVPKF